MMTLGICPVCNGTTRAPCPDNLRQHGQRNGWYGYDKSNDTVTCNNCGGQTMFGSPTGKVPLRADGTPCHHEYTGHNAGRCYTIYNCKHCSFRFDIDSSD